MILGLILVVMAGWCCVLIYGLMLDRERLRKP